MARSYIDSALLLLGASSGVLIGLLQESWSFVFSLTSLQGWKQLYTGTTAPGSKKVDHGSSKPIYASSVSKQGAAKIADFLGTRPPELQPEVRSSPVYTSKPSLSNGSAAAPTLGRDSPSSAQYAFQSTQGPIRFSQPAGSPSRPNFDSPPTPTSNSPIRTSTPPPPANPLPAALASPAAVTFSGSATPLASPVSTPLSSTPLLSSAPPPRTSTPPPPLSPTAPPRVSTPPPRSYTPPPPLSSAVTSAPSFAGGSDVERSPPGPASETFTDDDMSSTTEEIGAQPISNAGKIKKLRKRISTKLRGIKT